MDTTILNLGSLNIDRVFRVPRIVRQGETIAARSLEVFAGGKGANQSVALARAGAKVIHAGKIGEVKLARGLCYKPRPLESFGHGSSGVERPRREQPGEIA